MPKLTSQRTCIGCRTKKNKQELIRVMVNKAGKVVIDNHGKLGGRGAYFCKINNQTFVPSEGQGKLKIKNKCLEEAIKKKVFKYAFKREIDQNKLSKTANSGDFRAC